MKRSRLDKIDKKILRRLQSDGRVTNIALSRAVGISAPPCLRRVRALEEAGYIKGYNAKINHDMMGYGVTIFAMVKLKTQSKQDLIDFEKHVEALPMVRESYLIAGEVDYVLKIVAKSWDDYQTLFSEALSGMSNVLSLKSSLSIRTSKREPGVPID